MKRPNRPREWKEYNRWSRAEHTDMEIMAFQVIRAALAELNTARKPELHPFRLSIKIAKKASGISTAPRPIPVHPTQKGLKGLKILMTTTTIQTQTNRIPNRMSLQPLHPAASPHLTKGHQTTVLTLLRIKPLLEVQCLRKNSAAIQFADLNGPSIYVDIMFFEFTLLSKTPLHFLWSSQMAYRISILSC